MHASSDVLTTLPLTCIPLKTFYLLLIDVTSLNYTINFTQCECTSFSKYIRQNTFWTMTVAQVVKKTLCFIKPKAHCRFLKSMPLDLYLSQNKLADKITHSYCFRINSDQMIPSTARYREWSLACTVLNNSLYASHPSDPSGIPFPPQPPLLTSLITILWRAQIVKLWHENVLQSLATSRDKTHNVHFVHFHPVYHIAKQLHTDQQRSYINCQVN
jgi:hypothetical protein